MTNDEFFDSIKIEGEVWKDIVGYEGLYKVSSLGRVVSLGRVIPNGRKPRFWEAKLLKFTKNRGYSQVGLNKDSNLRTFKVHRLVAKAFIDNPNNYPEIDHLNRVRDDNRVENLRWCTHSMNMLNENTQLFCKEARKGLRITKNWRPVLMIKDGIVIKRYENLFSVVDDGFELTSVCKACDCPWKTHRGYRWMHEDVYLKRERNKQLYSNSRVGRPKQQMVAQR